MPPKAKYQREQIVQAALEVARERGIEAVTAREVAALLHISPRPIFTWYDTMDQLRRDVCERAEALYREYIRRGLEEPIPFQGVGRQYIRFAREEPQLYRLLFLTRPGVAGGGATRALAMSQAMARESVMAFYRLDARQADAYFRDLWLVAYSFATLIVTGDCPYTDAQIAAVMAEVSLSVCKAYKEIPGLSEGTYDRDAVFRALVERQ